VSELFPTADELFMKKSCSFVLAWPLRNYLDVERNVSAAERRNKMKHRVVITSLVLSGSLALGAGSAFSQDASESKPGGNLPGSAQPGDPGSGVDKSLGRTGMGKEQGQSGMSFSSEEIKQIQQALKEKGHDPGSATGEMNAETRAAIREFQKANNLSATGTVDEETAQKLGVSISGSTGTGASGAAPRSDHESLPRGGASGSPDLGSGSSGSDSKQ
jgi:hypothetical protein